MSDLSPRWEKVKIAAHIAASVFIPLVIALSGYWVSTAIKERETQARYVELAIGVLTKKPEDQSKELRGWAITVLDRFSPVPIPDAMRNELSERALFIEELKRKVLEYKPKEIPPRD